MERSSGTGATEKAPRWSSAALARGEHALSPNRRKRPESRSQAASGRSGGALFGRGFAATLQSAALVFGETAPHARVLAGLQGVLQGTLGDGAGGAPSPSRSTAGRVSTGKKSSGRTVRQAALSRQSMGLLGVDFKPCDLSGSSSGSATRRCGRNAREFRCERERCCWSTSLSYSVMKTVKSRVSPLSILGRHRARTRESPSQLRRSSASRRWLS